MGQSVDGRDRVLMTSLDPVRPPSLERGTSRSGGPLASEAGDPGHASPSIRPISRAHRARHQRVAMMDNMKPSSRTGATPV